MQGVLEVSRVVAEMDSGLCGKVESGEGGGVMGKISHDDKSEIEERLASGESLNSIARAKGVCYQSLQYWREKWDLPKLKPIQKRGSEHPNWRGGVSTNNGYKIVYSTSRRRKVHPYYYEHILVAEQTIGRPITRNEHVHHLNGNKLDNRPENLLVCTASQHRILHRQLEEFALELVRQGRIVYRDGKYEWAN